MPEKKNKKAYNECEWILKTRVEKLLSIKNCPVSRNYFILKMMIV